MTKIEASALGAVARAIASNLGYEWDTLYAGKSEWVADRGSRHDINVPYKPDFTEAAQAAITAYLSASKPAQEVEPAKAEHVASPDRMLKISKLIADLQDVHTKFGDTCVYIRRGGLSWGAVALNRQADDKKDGVFDLQATHDRDMADRLAQIERLIADRNDWRDRAIKAAASPPDQSLLLEQVTRERDAAVKQLAEVAEALDFNVNNEELLRIRNMCEANDWDVKIWSRILQRIVDGVRRARTLTERTGS